MCKSFFLLAFRAANLGQCVEPRCYDRNTCHRGEAELKC